MADRLLCTCPTEVWDDWRSSMYSSLPRRIPSCHIKAGKANLMSCNGAFLEQNVLSRPGHEKLQDEKLLRQ